MRNVFALLPFLLFAGCAVYQAADETASAPAFGLAGRDVSTLEQVGLDVGVTRERVRQIQVEALAKLRVLLENRGYSLDSLLVG